MSLYVKVAVFFKLVLKKVLTDPGILLNPAFCFRKLTDYFRFNPYGCWLDRNKTDESKIKSMKLALETIKYKPSVSAVLLTGITNGKTFESLKAQVYPFHEIIPVENTGSLLTAIEKAKGEYLVFVREGDILYPNTLYELVCSLNEEGKMSADLVFSDHDCYRGNKRTDPFFKPGWSRDLFLVKNYLYRSVLIKRNSVTALSELDTCSDYDASIYGICLKISRNGLVVHCPGILFSYPKSDLNAHDPEESQVRSDILIQDNIQVSVNKYSVPSIIRYMVSTPKISIIIPTCFKDDLIISCLHSVISKSNYPDYELIVLDNSRKGPSFGEEKLKDFDCRRVYIDEPFNWAKFNNIGVSHSTGDVYLFLNDDTEVITGDWLERMASNAVRPEIGAVGALLLFPDGSVQHAGIYLVDHGGGARHFFVNLPENYKGYHNILHYQRNVIGVTGACQMISKDKFQGIGGFDETFSVVSNDVDLCLRLWDRGYSNLYLPEVRLIHKEKASRGTMAEDKDTSEFWRRWGRLLMSGDPYLNKYLSQEHPDLRIRLN